MSETLASHTQWIQHAVAAAKAGNPSVAKIHLQKASEAVPGDPVIWLWMGWLADSPASAVQCLQLARTEGRFEKVAVAGIEFAKALADFEFDQRPESVTEECEDSSVDVVEQGSLPLDPVEAVEEVVAAVEALQHEDNVEPEVSKVEDGPIESSRDESVDTACQDAEAVHEQTPATLSRDDVEAELMRSANDLWQAADDLDVVDDSNVDAPNVDGDSVVDSATASEEVAHESRGGQQLWRPATDDLPELIVDESEDDFSFATDDDTDGDDAAGDGAEFGTTVPRHVPPSPFGGSVEHLQNAGDQWLGQQVAASPESPVWRKAQSDWFSIDGPSEPQSGNLYSSADRVDSSTTEAIPVQRDSSLAIERQPAATSAAATSAAATENSATSAAATENSATERSGVAPTSDAKSSDAQTQPAVPRVTASDVWQTAAIEKSSLTAARTVLVPAYQPLQPPLAVQPQSLANPETGPMTGAIPQPPVATSVPASSNIFDADSGSEQSSTRGPAHAGPLGQKTVLVVDDSPTVRKLVAITLEKRGYKVVSAFDGVAAIKEIAAHSPSLILMDVNMPRLDGYQLCKLVKKHETTRHIPVLMLTGKDGMFDRLRGRLVGCVGSIAKPFAPEELLAIVEQNIAKAAL